MITLKQISKSFGGVKANQSISIDFPKNKITALIGPNGCGKSTLFNIIAGSLKQDLGKVFFENKELTHWSITKRATYLSRVFQKSALFDYLTVEENLKLAKHSSSLLKSFSLKKYDVDELLKKVSLQNKKHELCKELSYGQKRLIEIIRAVLDSHEVLLLDEPIAGVTPHIRKIIAQLLLDLKESGETIILIEHDLDFIKIADHVILMGDGKVILEGTYDNVLKHKTLRKTYLGQ